jgi:hypothetical protein
MTTKDNQMDEIGMSMKHLQKLKDHEIEPRSEYGNRVTERTPIARLRAVVEFPLYGGDTIDRSGNLAWDWFVYEEPGIAPGGLLATCRRQCKVISSEVVPVVPQRETI